MPGEQSAELDRCRAQEGERSAATTALFPTNRLGPFQSFQLGSTQSQIWNKRILEEMDGFATDLQFLKTFNQSSVKEKIFSEENIIKIERAIEIF